MVGGVEGDVGDGVLVRCMIAASENVPILEGYPRGRYSGVVGHIGV